MHSLLDSRHLWHVHLSERLPTLLPPTYDTVRVGLVLGVQAIDELVDAGGDVGPLSFCLAHRHLLVPVESGTTDRWHATHSTCTGGKNMYCAEGSAHSYQQRCTRLWVSRPHPDPSPTTAADALHHALSLTRSRMRTPHQPLRSHRSQVCHA